MLRSLSVVFSCDLSSLRASHSPACCENSLHRNTRKDTNTDGGHRAQRPRCTRDQQDARRCRQREYSAPHWLLVVRQSDFFFGRPDDGGEYLILFLLLLLGCFFKWYQSHSFQIHVRFTLGTGWYSYFQLNIGFNHIFCLFSLSLFFFFCILSKFNLTIFLLSLFFVALSALLWSFHLTVNYRS